jgi:hypothetical protein
MVVWTPLMKITHCCPGNGQAFSQLIVNPVGSGVIVTPWQSLARQSHAQMSMP